MLWSPPPTPLAYGQIDCPLFRWVHGSRIFQLPLIRLGRKLNLSRTPDTNVLNEIVMKLQKRVLVEAATLLIKVKAHRGDTLKGEADIRVEL